MSSRGAAFGVAGAIVAGLSACQSYEPAPLDLDGHRRAWLDRLPSDEGVAAFAARLDAEEGAERGPSGVLSLDDGVSMREGEAVALLFNPDLRVARLRAGATRATAEHAGLWDDPVLGFDFERIIENVDDPWVVGATIGLTLPISGRLAVEVARADAAHVAELRRVAEAEWAVRVELRRAWMEWSAQRLHADLARELAARLDAVVAIVGTLEEAGELTRTEARLFRIERATRAIEIAAIEARERELELRLRSIMGLAPEAAVRLEARSLGIAALERPPAAGGGDAALDLLAARSPSLATLRASYEVAEQSLRLAIREQYPDLQIGPGLESDEGQGRVLLGVSVPLAAWNGNRGAIAEAAAARDVARGEFETEFERLAGRLAAAQANLDASRARRETLERVVVPLVEEQDAESRRVAELGDVDAILLLESLTRLADTKAALIEARLAESLAAVQIEELIGPAIAGGAPDGPAQEEEVSP